LLSYHLNRIFNNVLSPASQMKMFSEVFAMKKFGLREGAISSSWISSLIPYVGEDALQIFPPEFRDSVLYSPTHPMPDILPDTADICSMSEDEIEARIASYVGKDIASLHDSLRPNRYATSGFIGENDRLGTVIKKDAELLQKLGISRHKLADRLEAAMLVAKEQSIQREGWEVDPEKHASMKITAEKGLGTFNIADLPFGMEFITSHGTQWDPFHPTMGNPSTGAHTDYFISTKERNLQVMWEMLNNNSTEVIRFCALHPSHIRRMCFFENTSYRLDPELVVRFLFDPNIKVNDKKLKN